MSLRHLRTLLADVVECLRHSGDPAHCRLTGPQAIAALTPYLTWIDGVIGGAP